VHHYGGYWRRFQMNKLIIYNGNYTIKTYPIEFDEQIHCLIFTLDEIKAVQKLLEMIKNIALKENKSEKDVFEKVNAVIGQTIYY